MQKRSDVAQMPNFHWRIAISFSCLFALAFFVRHIAGYAVSGREYTPFVYSNAEIAAQPHTKYDRMTQCGMKVAHMRA